MRSLNPLVVTYNCGRQPVQPDVFARYLIESLQARQGPEIVVLALQEIAPIAYAFLGGSFLSFYYQRLLQTVELAAQAWQAGPYVNIFRKNIGMTAMLVFVQGDHVDHVRAIESGSVGVGVLEMGNKGAVGARIAYSTKDGVMHLTFVSAHLAPMEEALERRNQDWAGIVQRLVFESNPGVDSHGVLADYVEPGNTAEGEALLSQTETNIYSKGSHVFVAGDLNYRTSGRKPTSQDYALYPQPGQNELDFLKRDQLGKEMQAGRTLHNFIEAPVTFSPTYKYSDVRRLEAQTSEQLPSATRLEADDPTSSFGWARHRWPSWCDRVLYLDTTSSVRSSDGSSDRLQLYQSLPLMSSSDHRAVFLQASLPLEPTDSSSPVDTLISIKSPFPTDPLWRQRRAAARQKEVVVGLLAYLGTTWEGNGIVLALFFGALGGWALLKSMII